MWGIFWTIFSKSMITWLVIFVMLVIWAIIQIIVTQDEDLEDALVTLFMNLWKLIGMTLIIISAIIISIMIIISIWS